MKRKKRSFKERYSNNWICTLKQVDELKKALLSKYTEEVRFWSDGTWASRKHNEIRNDTEDSLFILTKDEMQFVNQDTVDNSLYSICHLIFGLDHPLSNLDIHEYLLERKNTDIKSFLQRDLFRKNHHTYSFVFTYDDLDFKCAIEWENSSRSLRVLLNDGTIGIADKEKYIDFNDLFDDYHDLYGYMDIGAIESHIYWFVDNNILEPFDIRKKKCIYTNSYEILLDKSYPIEWNYLEECFRIKKADESYKYFDSAGSLIDYLLSIVSDLDNVIKDIYNKKIAQLAYVICENLDDNDKYNYLLDKITTYEDTKRWMNSLLNDPDLPF